jgi:hypothetical protein
MGWDFSSAWTDKATLVAAIKSDLSKGTYHPLESRTVGNCLWLLTEHRDTGEKLIVLALLAKDRRTKEWGYKVMSEDMHPYSYSCPTTLLDKAGGTRDESALAWRLKVRETAEAKKAAKAAKEMA